MTHVDFLWALATYRCECEEGHSVEMFDVPDGDAIVSMGNASKVENPDYAIIDEEQNSRKYEQFMGLSEA